MKKISLIILAIIYLTACSKHIESIKPEFIEVPDIAKPSVSQKLSFNNAFSISFWLKPDNNYYGSPIISLSDDNENIALLNNSEDANYLATGLSLVHQNGILANGANFVLDTYNYNFIVLTYVDNTFFLYLNNELIGEKVFSDDLNPKDLTLNIEAIGEYLEFNTYDYCLGTEEIKTSYLNNAELRLYNIDYPESFKANAKGKVALPHSNLQVDYSSNSNMLWLDNGFLRFENNPDAQDKTVTLTAKTAIADKTIAKTIDFTLRGQNDQNTLANVKNTIDNQLEYVISESNTFDEQLDGVTIKYQVLSDNAEFVSGHFIKTSDEEKANVKIKVDLSLNDLNESIEKELILLDEYAGYLLVYFDGHDGWPEHITGEESIYLAYSYDLNDWTKLNKEKIITSEEGSGRFRDPYITRAKDGSFIITSTEGYNNPGMYVIKSNDLISFACRHLSFTSTDFALGLDGNESWAPEVIYNAKDDKYTIIYSDPGEHNHSIYAVDTKDFINFSYPYIYFNASYNAIDANIKMLANQYYMMFKNETNGEIYYAVSDTLSNPTWRIYDDIAKNEGYMEGPFLLNDHINNRFRLYLDSYKESLIYSSDIYKWKDTIDTYPDVDMGLSEFGGVRHFSIIELTQSELDCLIDYY